MLFFLKILWSEVTFLIFQSRVLGYSLGLPGPYYVDHIGFELVAVFWPEPTLSVEITGMCRHAWLQS